MIRLFQRLHHVALLLGSRNSQNTMKNAPTRNVISPSFMAALGNHRVDPDQYSNDKNAINRIITYENQDTSHLFYPRTTQAIDEESSSSSLPETTPLGLVVLKEIDPYRGRGLFATQLLQAGIIVCEEEALCHAPNRKVLIGKVQQHIQNYHNFCRPAGSLLQDSKRATIAKDDNYDVKVAEGIVKCNYFDCGSSSSSIDDEQNDDDDSTTVGASLFERIAMLNHSCCPNASVVLQIKNPTTTTTTTTTSLSSSAPVPTVVKAQVIVAKPIQADEEVTISYTSHQMFKPTFERRQFLRNQWGFDCECPRCSSSSSVVSAVSSNGTCLDKNEQPHPTTDTTTTNNIKDDGGTAHGDEMNSFWTLLEHAAALADANKPRTKHIDPTVVELQTKAVQEIETYGYSTEYWKEGIRFTKDAKYFS